MGDATVVARNAAPGQNISVERKAAAARVCFSVGVAPDLTISAYLNGAEIVLVVVGPPNKTMSLETAPALNGSWEFVQAVHLGVTGPSEVKLPVTQVEAMRFCRLRLEPAKGCPR